MSKKDALFGKSQSKASGTTSVSNISSSTAVAPASKSSGKTSGLSLDMFTGNDASFMSSETKRKHIEEGNQYHESALKALQTSIFQWKPDHISAASMFERSANCYKTAQEYERARMDMVQVRFLLRIKAVLLT